MTTPDTPDALLRRAYVALEVEHHQTTMHGDFGGDGCGVCMTLYDLAAALRSATEKPNTFRADPSPSVEGGDSHRAAVATPDDSYATASRRLARSLVDLATELRPCPFCGYRPGPNNNGLVSCKRGTCPIWGITFAPSAWNRRATEAKETTTGTRPSAEGQTETAAAVDGGAQPVGEVASSRRHLAMGTIRFYNEDCVLPIGTRLYAVPQQGQPQPAVIGWVRLAQGHTGPVAAEVEWGPAHPMRVGQWRALAWANPACLTGATHWAASPLPETPPPTEEKR